ELCRDHPRPDASASGGALVTDTDKFWQWYEAVQRIAAESETGQRFAAAGFHVAHTGGGCLAWERNFDDETYIWICDLCNGLGEREDECYLVGFYNKDADVLADGDVPSLTAALAWAEARIAEVRP